MLQISVNGRKHEVKAAPDTPLLYVLRNELDLHGPKFGCGLGECGACTVHVDGEDTRSCVLQVSDAAGKAITTLEGLTPPHAADHALPAHAHLHPVQQAFIEEQAAQCGYCTNGMIMSAAALLAKTPKPSDAEIRKALAYNLCRCGTHMRILRAVKSAATKLA
jgi:nicotinate dehydrogenase subunit A